MKTQLFSLVTLFLVIITLCFEMYKHSRFVLFCLSKDFFTTKSDDAKFFIYKAALHKPFSFVTNFFIDLIILTKWIRFIKIKDQKTISKINYSLERVVYFQQSAYLKDQIVNYLLQNQDLFLAEISTFEKFDKGYVLKRLCNFFPETRRTLPLRNKMNELIFEKAIVFICRTGFITSDVFDLFDIEQQTRATTFLNYKKIFADTIVV